MVLDNLPPHALPLLPPSLGPAGGRNIGQPGLGSITVSGASGAVDMALADTDAAAAAARYARIDGRYRLSTADRWCAGVCGERCGRRCCQKSDASKGAAMRGTGAVGCCRVRCELVGAAAAKWEVLVIEEDEG